MFNDEERSLLANMWLSSESDHWMIYCDWLREHDRNDHADAIEQRLTDSRRPKKLPGWLQFLWDLRPNREQFLHQFATHDSWSWNGERLGNDAIIGLMCCPHLAEVTKVNLSYNRLEASGVEAIANCSYFHRVTTLNLSWNNLGNTMRYLADSLNLPVLQSLDLSYGRLTPSDGNALVLASNWPQLKECNLEMNPALRRHREVLSNRYRVNWGGR